MWFASGLGLGLRGVWVERGEDMADERCVLVVTQGGDWGAHITRIMGWMYPENVKGMFFSAVHTSHPCQSLKLPTYYIHTDAY